jgi:predicted nucleic acid-binding protein
VADAVVVDTSVLAHLTKSGRHTAAYATAVGSRTLAVSFQSEAELLSADYSAARQARLNAFLASSVRLKHSDLTTHHYAVAARERRRRRPTRLAGSGASDGDLWIIAGALEHSLVLLTHDTHQVHLGRALGIEVFTQLAELREANPVL